jgi:hypothetical protein
MFKFGNKKPTIFNYAIVGVVLTSIIAGLSNCTGIHENKLWDLLDEIQRKYFPQTILNEFILKDPEKLNRRIIRDVDKAIRDVTPEYDRIISDDDRKFKPRYVEKPIDPNLQTGESRLLGGEMRICAHWVDDCPKE